MYNYRKLQKWFKCIHVHPNFQEVEQEIHHVLILVLKIATREEIGLGEKHDVEFWRNFKPRPDYRGLEIMLIKRGLTKTQLREQLGFSTGTLARFKKGEYVSLDLLLKICVFLNCSLGDIVDVHPSERIKPKP